jgi:beta propeller repeat protein
MKKTGGGLIMINKKLYSVTLASVALILFLILVPSAAAAAPLTLTETQISTSGNASNADIYGNTIVWQDTRNDGNPDIYTYDTSTKKETRITKSGSAVNPAIYGSRIVYEKYVTLNPDEPWNLTSDIYMYDISTKKETRTTTNGNSFAPDIYSNNIVWSNHGIYLYDLSTKKVTKIVEDVYDETGFFDLGTYNTNPALCGNRIVWLICDDGPGGDPTYYYVGTYDLSTKKETEIGNYWDDCSYPKICNDRIVYIPRECGESGCTYNLYMYDLSTKKETQIITSGSAGGSTIYGNRIVYADTRNGNTDIYMHDLSTNTETQITTSGLAYNPAIYEDEIVWRDGRNGKSDIYMVVVPQPKSPVAAFSASPTSGNLPLKVQFSDKSTGSPTSWKWNFGDGKNSTSRNPAYTYTKAGKYTVSLTVKNAAGTNTKTIKDYITVKTAPVKPVAAFSAKPTSGNVPLKVTFTDKSTGNPTSWKWTFGDGKISTSKNPAYTYIKAGKYTVSLTVKNAAGSSTKTIKNYIVVNTLKAPIASFSAKPTSGKAPLNVQFTDKSSNSPTSWKWNFGDGTYSTAKNPVHKYIKVGKYTASLTVKNAKGSNTKTISNYIIVKK